MDTQQEKVKERQEKQQELQQDQQNQQLSKDQRNHHLKEGDMKLKTFLKKENLMIHQQPEQEISDAQFQGNQNIDIHHILTPHLTQFILTPHHNINHHHHKHTIIITRMTTQVDQLQSPTTINQIILNLIKTNKINSPC